MLVLYTGNRRALSLFFSLKILGGYGTLGRVKYSLSLPTFSVKTATTAVHDHVNKPSRLDDHTDACTQRKLLYIHHWM